MRRSFTVRQIARELLLPVPTVYTYLHNGLLLSTQSSKGKQHLLDLDECRWAIHAYRKEIDRLGGGGNLFYRRIALNKVLALREDLLGRGEYFVIPEESPVGDTSRQNALKELYAYGKGFLVGAVVMFGCFWLLRLILPLK